MKNKLMCIALGALLWHFIQGTSPAYWIAEAQYWLSQAYEMSAEEMQ